MRRVPGRRGIIPRLIILFWYLERGRLLAFHFPPLDRTYSITNLKELSPLLAKQVMDAANPYIMGCYDCFIGSLENYAEHFQLASKLEPWNFRHLFATGYALEKQDKDSEAMEQFIMAADIEPNNPFPHAAWGGVLLTQAHSLFRQADESKSEELLKQARSKCEEGVAKKERAFALDPDPKTFGFQLALAKESLKSISKMEGLLKPQADYDKLLHSVLKDKTSRN